MPRRTWKRYLRVTARRIWFAPPERRRVRRCNKEDEMRKFLLASVATLGTGGLTGVALAQPAGGPVGAPTQGQQAYPAAPAPVAYVNENNNYQAPMLPGPLANPTPGSIVVHFNGKVVTELQGQWSSLQSRFAGTFPATAANPVVGVVKTDPQTLNTFARLYAGADGMATN